MTLSDIMQACGRASKLCATATERAGVERAAAAILDSFGLPATGGDRAHFLRLFDKAKGA